MSSRLHQYLEHSSIEGHEHAVDLFGQIKRMIQNKIKDEDQAEELIDMIREYGETVADEAMRY